MSQFRSGFAEALGQDIHGYHPFGSHGVEAKTPRQGSPFIVLSAGLRVATDPR